MIHLRSGDPVTRPPGPARVAVLALIAAMYAAASAAAGSRASCAGRAWAAPCEGGGCPFPGCPQVAVHPGGQSTPTPEAVDFTPGHLIWAASPANSACAAA
ncbi:hypothetical protein ACWDDN_22430 [Streptomyces griseoruber]